MAYLNRDERDKLMRDLTTMRFNQAKGKLRRIDPQGKLAYLRNAQETGEYWTRFELYGLGTVVTLVERESEAQVADDQPGSAPVRLKPDYELAEVMVEPMPDNHT